MAARVVPDQRHRRIRGQIAVLTVTVAILLTWSPFAVAVADVVKTPYSGSETGIPDDSCGYATTVDRTWSGVHKLRQGKGVKDSFFFTTDKYEFRNEYTVTATGEKFVIRGNGKFKDVKATPLGDNRFEVTSTDSNQPIVVENSGGKVVLRTTGVVKYHYVVDTAGDDNPDTTEFVEFLGAESSGQYPGLSTCNLAGLVVGTGSAERLTAHPLGSTPSPMGYYEYLPPGYRNSSDKAPLLIFLHGYGGSGDGSPEQLSAVINDTAIPFYIANNGWNTSLPFVVLAPQHHDLLAPYPCDNVPFSGSCVMQVQHDRGNPPDGSPCTTPAEVKAFLDYALATYNVDPTRIYLTGLSCGGYGVWESLAQWGAGVIAAAVPIAGEGRPAWKSSQCALAAAPIWAFHGDLDDTVEPAGSIETIGELQTCPDAPELKLTTYPDVGHDSWNHAYSGSQAQDIYSWMLGFSTAPS